MIMLSPQSKINFELYDVVYYATTTCPRMREGCIHRPDIAGSKGLYKYIYELHDEEKFYAEYVKEMRSEPAFSKLKEIVAESSMGKWIQLIFYEEDANDGERKYLYSILKEMTNDVKVE